MQLPNKGANTKQTSCMMMAEDLGHKQPVVWLREQPSSFLGVAGIGAPLPPGGLAALRPDTGPVPGTGGGFLCQSWLKKWNPQNWSLGKWKQKQQNLRNPDSLNLSHTLVSLLTDAAFVCQGNWLQEIVGWDAFPTDVRLIHWLLEVLASKRPLATPRDLHQTQNRRFLQEGVFSPIQDLHLRHWHWVFPVRIGKMTHVLGPSPLGKQVSLDSWRCQHCPDAEDWEAMRQVRYLSLSCSKRKALVLTHADIASYDGSGSSANCIELTEAGVNQAHE